MDKTRTQTIEEAIKSESPAIAIIDAFDKEKNGDSNIVKAILTIMIGELVQFLNVGKNMEPTQLQITINDVINDYRSRNLKPEDFRVIFTRIRRGEYGALYDRFDGQVLLMIIHKYCDEREGLCEHINTSQHMESKFTGIANALKPYIEQMKKDIDSIRAKERSEKTDLALTKMKLREKTPIEKMINGFIDEFQKEWRENRVVTDEGRFIKYKDNVMSEWEYVEAKVQEAIEASKRK